jgi:hypothetical protein
MKIWPNGAGVGAVVTHSIGPNFENKVTGGKDLAFSNHLAVAFRLCTRVICIMPLDKKFAICELSICE